MPCDFLVSFSPCPGYLPLVIVDVPTPCPLLTSSRCPGYPCVWSWGWGSSRSLCVYMCVLRDRGARRPLSPPSQASSASLVSPKDPTSGSFGGRPKEPCLPRPMQRWGAVWSTRLSPIGCHVCTAVSQCGLKGLGHSPRSVCLCLIAVCAPWVCLLCHADSGRLLRREGDQVRKPALSGHEYWGGVPGGWVHGGCGCMECVCVCVGGRGWGRMKVLLHGRLLLARGHFRFNASLPRCCSACRTCW